MQKPKTTTTKRHRVRQASGVAVSDVRRDDPKYAAKIPWQLWACHDKAAGLLLEDDTLISWANHVRQTVLHVKAGQTQTGGYVAVAVG